MLTGKYLKYSPEITLEIFTLVWESFERAKYDLGAGLETIFNNWKRWNHIMLDDNSVCTTNNSALIGKLSETTVQEILGYNPFVKEVIPEYVECIEIATCNTKVGEIFKCRHSSGFFEWEYNDKDKPNYNSWDGWSERQWSDSFVQIKFKPSTKEAFDAQNKPKPIEKWSVGSYGVVINSTNQRFPIGFIDEIILAIYHKKVEFKNYNSYDPGNLEYSHGLEFKWFATKSEAEEFAKTLVEPVLNTRLFPAAGSSVYHQNIENYLKKNHVIFESSKSLQRDKIKYICWNTEKYWFATDCSSKQEYTYSDLDMFLEISKETMKMEKYIIDNIYKIEWDNHFCICKYEKMNDSDRMFGYYIANSNGKLKFERSTPWITDRTVTLASKEDCEWLELCIKTNKFMEKPIQSIKLAVHCKSQEEWDFVLSKIDYKQPKDSFRPGCNSVVTVDEEDKSNIGCVGSDFLFKNVYQILSFQEWCDLNGYKIESKCDFIVGEWYKMNDCWYLRYRGKDIVATDKIYMSECIDSTFNHKYDNGFFTYLHEQKTWRLASIEEIQQYLPDNHPDKIKSNKEFKVGDFVLMKSKGTGNGLPSNLDSVIIQLLKIDENKNPTGHFKHDADFMMCYNGNYYRTNKKCIIRHATPDELYQHLISIGQIPAGEPLNTGIEPNKDGMFKYTTAYADTSNVWSTRMDCGSSIAEISKSKVETLIEFNYLPEPK